MSSASGWNIKQVMAQRILRDMIAKGRGKEAGVVLVVDPHTSKILSSCLRMHDLLAAGVLVLQNLCLQREKLDLPALYFIDPNSEEAFELLIDDFPKPPPPVPQPHVSAVTSALQSLALTSAPPPAHHSTKQICQYSSAHLFFTGPVPDERMKQLQSSNIDMRKIKSFVELNMDFLAFESRVFHLDQPHWIPRLYFGEAAENGPSKAVLAPLVVQLQGLLSTILPKNEHPYVRYISDDLNIGKTFVSRQLATLVDRALVKQLKDAATPPVAVAGAAVAAPSPPPPTRNTTLLIVDRSLDPLTPLMHEFTFQAMVNDLLRVTGSEIVHLQPKASVPVGGATESPGQTMTNSTKVALQKQLEEMKAGGGKPPIPPPAAAAEKKDDASEDSNEVVLSEEDALWLEYRHKHIGEVMIGVNKKIKEFASSNKMAQFQHVQAQLAQKHNTGKDSVKDVIRAVADMPEYRLAMRRFTKHVSLAQECLDKFRIKSLQQIGELEQCLATNTNAEGKIYKPDSRELKDRLKEIVCDTEKSISVLDKLRLIAIYAIVQGGLPPPLFQKISPAIHPKLLKRIVGRNLEEFGVDIESFTPQLSRDRVQELLERNESQTLALMRYTPSLQSIMEGLVSNTLPMEQFPYTKSGARPTAEEEELAHTAANGKSSSRNGSASSSSKKEKGLLSSKASKEKQQIDPEEAARAKLLLEAEKDVAHRATGKSARRKKPSDGDPLKPQGENAVATTPKQPEPVVEEEEKPRRLSGSSSAPSSFTVAAPVSHRYIVFVLGGLTFSEMRSTYEVAEGRGAEIIVGSTAPLTPAEFLLDLSGLTRKEFHACVVATTAKPAAAPTPSAAAAPAKTPVASAAAAPAKRPVSKDDVSSSSDSSTDSDSSEDEAPAKKNGKPSTASSTSKPPKKPIIKEDELKFDEEVDETEEEEEQVKPKKPASKPIAPVAAARTPGPGKLSEKEREPAPRPPRSAR